MSSPAGNSGGGLIALFEGTRVDSYTAPTAIPLNLDAGVFARLVYQGDYSWQTLTHWLAERPDLFSHTTIARVLLDNWNSTER